MAQVECHGCERDFDEQDVRWVHPFEGGHSTDGQVIETYSKVHDKPVPGAVPYCPECLTMLIASADE